MGLRCTGVAGCHGACSQRRAFLAFVRDVRRRIRSGCGSLLLLVPPLRLLLALPFSPLSLGTANAMRLMKPPHLLLEALDPLLLLGEAAADVLEPILELLVRLHELLVHVPKFLATTSPFELLTEPTGHLLDVAVEIASVLLKAAVEFILRHAAHGRGLMSGGHPPTVELRPLAAALGTRLTRTTVRQRRKRRLAVRRGPTETGLEAIELAENLIELFGDVGVRTDVLNINGNGSHRRRREWGCDMRQKRRLELGLPVLIGLRMIGLRMMGLRMMGLRMMGLPWMMRPLRSLRRLLEWLRWLGLRLGRALHRLDMPGDDTFETFDRVEGEACGSTGALLHLAVRPDLDTKREHRHLRRQDDRSPLPGSEWPSPARRGPSLLSLIRLRGGTRRTSSPFSPPFRMLEEVDELGDRVVGGSLKPPRGHGPRFRLR